MKNSRTCQPMFTLFLVHVLKSFDNWFWRGHSGHCIPRIACWKRRCSSLWPPGASAAHGRVPLVTDLHWLELQARKPGPLARMQTAPNGHPAPGLPVGPAPSRACVLCPVLLLTPNQYLFIPNKTPHIQFSSSVCSPGNLAWEEC